METTQQTIDLSSLSAADLEAALAEKKKQERAEKEAAKQQYESTRDSMVNNLLMAAETHHAGLLAFKKATFDLLDAFREKAHEYGDIKSTSKGGFSLRSSDGERMVVLRRNVISEYDERADLALAQIREFLEETIKKRDMQTYRTISTLLERNAAGDLNPSRVADLLKIRDNYSDHRWVKAMDLLTESYRQRDVSYNIEFYKKDERGKDRMISLSFAGL